MCAHPVLLLPAVSPALPLYRFLTTDMVRTRGGSRIRPRVRFSTPEQAQKAPASAAVPDPVLEEPEGFMRYQTRMGPFPSASETIQEGPTLQVGPYIRTGGVIVIQASAITVPVSSRGELIAPFIACFEDQTTPFYWDPNTGERRFALEIFMEIHIMTCRH